jgi:hypothetical protein
VTTFYENIKVVPLLTTNLLGDVMEKISRKVPIGNPQGIFLSLWRLLNYSKAETIISFVPFRKIRK